MVKSRTGVERCIQGPIGVEPRNLIPSNSVNEVESATNEKFAIRQNEDPSNDGFYDARLRCCNLYIKLRVERAIRIQYCQIDPVLTVRDFEVTSDNYATVGEDNGISGTWRRYQV